jgi:hypothetical protein
MVFLLATRRQLLLTMEQRSWTTSIEEPHEMEQPAPTTIMEGCVLAPVVVVEPSLSRRAASRAAA